MGRIIFYTIIIVLGISSCKKIEPEEVVFTPNPIDSIRTDINYLKVNDYEILKIVRFTYGNREVVVYNLILEITKENFDKLKLNREKRINKILVNSSRVDINNESLIIKDLSKGEHVFQLGFLFDDGSKFYQKEKFEIEIK